MMTCLKYRPLLRLYIRRDDNFFKLQGHFLNYPLFSYYQKSPFEPEANKGKQFSPTYQKNNRTKPFSRRHTNCERLSLIFLFPNICFQSAPVTFRFARKVDNFRSESNLFILVRNKYVKISMLFLRIDHYACCYRFFVLSLIGVSVCINEKFGLGFLYPLLVT
jgi:hypothetical protein